jgi:hypothetical protein
MAGDEAGERARVHATIVAALVEAGLDFESLEEDTIVVEMPGEHKQRTTCSLVIGTHSLNINAFVARHPDENTDAVHRWLLERNARMFGVAFSIDQLGDIYLAGRLPLGAITTDEVDRILGSVLEYADGSFNTILELGFASSIKREWAWRVSRGQPTDNLRPFAHLLETPTGDR